jgi:uncharacterized protein (DUF169 family)
MSEALKNLLRLKTEPLAFRRMEDVSELNNIGNVYRIGHTFTFCQAQFISRVQGRTVGITREDKLFIRCSPFYGMREFKEDGMQLQANMLSQTWFGTPGEALEQIKNCRRIPESEAVVLAPLVKEKFEPEVVMIYGNPAQIVMLMSGLQKERYELFQFFFVGEGACTDSLGRCYQSGKPSLAIPCYGERSLGQVADDEIVIALPPGEIERAISGLDKLAKVGFSYPIAFIGGLADPLPMFSEIYG